MKGRELEPKPIADLTFLNAGRGPGQFIENRQLSDGLAAIVVTSDLHFQVDHKTLLPKRYLSR